MQLIGNEGDELGVGGLAFGVGDGVAEEFLQRFQIAAVPHASSMACRMARSTREGVVENVFATCGYKTFVMALITSISSTAIKIASRRY